MAALPALHAASVAISSASRTPELDCFQKPGIAPPSICLPAIPRYSPSTVQPNELRIALFSGNYNYHRDGANQALNRLVGYLLRQGVKVRVYSPTTDHPAFEPTGDLVSVPSVPIPGREEYQLGLGLWPSVRRDLAQFRPNVVHI